MPSSHDNSTETAAGPTAAATDTVSLPDDLKTWAKRPPQIFDHRERHNYLIAYDVRDARRLSRIHKKLKDWGSPVQYSVFECLLTGTQVEAMWQVVEETIDVEIDWVVLYRLSKPFNEAVRHIGVYDPGHIDSDTIIFI